MSRWSRPAGLGSPGGLVRMLAWAALVGATAMLAGGEVRRAGPPPGVSVHTDLVYRSVGGRQARLDVYLPDAPAPAEGRPAILALHGGGWRGGSKRDYGRMAAELARHGYAVIAVEYLLSRPGRPSWPGNFEDVREAVRWVRRHAADYQIDPGRIVALGASAGGHLAALLGTYPDGPVVADDPGEPSWPIPAAEPSARVQAVIDFYGPADLARWYARRPASATPLLLLLGDHPSSRPGPCASASPTRHVSPDDAPMLLIHGDDDRLVPDDQSRLLASALARAGVPHRLVIVEGARHGFGFRAGPRDLVPEILDFLDGVWGRPGRVGVKPERSPHVQNISQNSQVNQLVASPGP